MLLLKINIMRSPCKRPQSILHIKTPKIEIDSSQYPISITTPKTTYNSPCVTHNKSTSTNDFITRAKTSNLSSVLSLCRQTLRIPSKLSKTSFKFHMKKPDFYDTIYTYRPKIFTEKVEIVDNKLNIKYAENEKQYLQKIYKENEKYHYNTFHGQLPTLPKTKKKLKYIKEKITFLKYTVDFAYSDCVITKNKISSSNRKIDEKLIKSIKTFQRVDLDIKEKNDQFNAFLSAPLNIKKVNL